MTRGVGYALLTLSLVLLVVCSGLIGWKVFGGRRPKLSAVVDVAKPSKPPPPRPAAAPVVSTIIDLPGDPEIVRRGVIVAPRELRVDLPAKLAINAPKVEGPAYFLSTTLVSNSGGYMGKFPVAGQEADALAAKLQMDAAELAGGDSSIGGTVMDDDGGDLTDDYSLQQMLTDANSNTLEITSGGPSQGKQAVFKPVIPEKIADLLVAQGFSEQSARDAEAAAKALFNVQSLPARSAALALGAQDPSGAYRLTQLTIYESGEYVGTVALAENGLYVEGARPTPPDDLIGDGANAGVLATHFNLADGIYSSGLRNAIPEPVIREAIQLLGRVIDLNAALPADEALRALYARDFRDKSKSAGKLIYVGLSGSAGVYNCYSFEMSSGAFRCFDPKGDAAAVPLPPSKHGATGTASLGDSGAVGVGGILSPIKGAPVTSLFGMRFHPILHILRLHGGIDFGAPVGSQVRAAADGVVEIAGPVSGFGNHIRLQHKGFETSYSHLSEIPEAIKTGVNVHEGEIIALSGNTGLSTGPHLHFQFYLDGSPVDPLPHMGSEVQASAPSGGRSGAGGLIAVASAAQGGPSEAELHAFPFAKAQVDAVLEAAAKL